MIGGVATLWFGAWPDPHLTSMRLANRVASGQVDFALLFLLQLS